MIQLRTLVAYIGPNSAWSDAVTAPLVAQRPVSHADRGVLCGDKGFMARLPGALRVHSLKLPSGLFAPCQTDLHPAHKRGLGRVYAHAGDDFVLAIQAKVVVERRASTCASRFGSPMRSGIGRP